MKKLLAIAVAAALVAPAAAMAETTLYGKLHASYGEVKDNAGNKRTGVESHSSRIGIKGSHALNNGLEATYGLEYGIDLDGDDATGIHGTGNTYTTNTFTSRNQFVGVKGGFGEVRVGKHDTPAKLATAGQDVFADTYADMSTILPVDGHRVNNAVAYINKFGPVGVAVAHSTGTGLDKYPALDPTLPQTAFPKGDNGLNANSAMVNYGNGPWYAGLGYTRVDESAKIANLGLGWKAEAGHQVNLLLEQDKADGVNAKRKSALINGVAKVGAVSLKGQYGEAKLSGDDVLPTAKGKQKLASVGVDYSLGKKTAVYLLHSQNKNAALATDGSYKVKSTAVGLVTEF
jgi:predicted porin